MTELKSQAYARVLKKRADRLGISVEAAGKVDSSKPLYLTAAETAAARLGTTVEAVLQDDLRRIENSDYPTPNCLSPDDLEDLLAGLEERKLSAEVLLQPENLKSLEQNIPFGEQLRHLSTCDACRTLLVACRPSQARQSEFKKFLEEELQPALMSAAAFTMNR